MRGLGGGVEGLGGILIIYSLPVLFIKVEISLCTPVPLFRVGSVHSGLVN